MEGGKPPRDCKQSLRPYNAKQLSEPAGSWWCPPACDSKARRLARASTAYPLLTTYIYKFLLGSS